MTHVPGEPESQRAGPAEGLRREVGFATGATFVIFAADRVVQVVFLAILARLLGPAEFAVAAAATLFVSLVTLASHLGLTATVIQKPNLTARSVSTAGTLVLTVSTVLVVAAEAAAPLVGAWFRDPDVTAAVRVLAPVCLAHAFAFAPHALMTRKLRARALSTVDLVSGVIGQGLVAIPLAFLGWSYWALVAGVIAHAISRLAAVRLMERSSFSLNFDLAEARRLLSRGAGFSLTVFLQRIAAEGDRVIVGRFLGMADLGLYARAAGLMAFPAALYGTVVDRAVFPAFAKVHGERERLGRAYAGGLALTALAGAPVATALFILGPEVIAFVLGPAWLGAVAPFKLLSLAAYFRMADRANGALLRGAGRPYLMAGVQTAAALALIGACMVVVQYGIAAVAGAVALASLVSFLVLTGAAMRVAGVGPAAVVRAHGPAAASALLAAVLLAVPVHFARRAGWEPLPILAAAAASAALGLPLIVAAPGLFLGPAGREAVALAWSAVTAGRRRAPVSPPSNG